MAAPTVLMKCGGMTKLSDGFAMPGQKVKQVQHRRKRLQKEKAN